MKVLNEIAFETRLEETHVHLSPFVRFHPPASR